MTDNQLNPEIRTVKVGVRQLREVTIYPLSIHDQDELVKLLGNVISDLGQNVDFENANDEKALEFLHQLVFSNLEKVLEFVTDEKERPTLKELTNNQFYEIVNAIFEMNYEGLIKNFKDLFGRIGLGNLRKMAQTRKRKRK